MEGDFFDLRDAMFVSDAPRHSDFLSASDAQRLSPFVRKGDNAIHILGMSHSDRVRIAEGIVRYYRLHVAGFPELRSLAVLKELWR